MSYLKKSQIALAVVLTWIVALPPLQSQTRAFSNVLQLDSDGAYLGIQMKDVTSDDVSKYKLSKERGVIVSSVVKGSPAEAANLKEGDVILEFGEFAVWSSSQFTRLVQETPAGRKVDLVISRDGKRLNLSATLEDRDRRSAKNRAKVYSFPRDWAGPGQRSPMLQGPDMMEEMPDMPDRQGKQSEPPKARLGVTIQPLPDQLGRFLGVPGEKGVLVSSVIDGSPSAGKLKSGDVITGINGKAVDDPNELAQLVRDNSGGEVNLKVIRDKKEISVVVTLPASEKKGYKL